MKQIIKSETKGAPVSDMQDAEHLM